MVATSDSNTAGRAAAPRERFATTQWSLVVRAGKQRSGDGDRAPGAGEALAALCENYWFPLYAFVRRSGYATADAQDLTQEFFTRLLQRNYLANADRRRGRFRSFLLGAMKHFLANQQRRANAQRRGGGRSILSLDFHDGEQRYRRIEPVDNLSPERLYEKRWALAVLDLVLARLGDEFAAAGRQEQFAALKPLLSGGSTPAYAELGPRLGMSPGAVKVAVHRLRRRYRKLLAEEIMRTLDGPDALEEELAALLAAVGTE